MLYSCTHIANVSINGLNTPVREETDRAQRVYQMEQNS